MSTLQEVLAILLGAEAEAERVVNDAENDSEALLRTTREKFAAERINQMESAREQAKGIMNSALSSVKTESVQIADLGKEERERMQQRFEENVDPIIDSMVLEIADRFISKIKAEK